LEIALPYYCHVIKELKRCKVECLEALFYRDLETTKQYQLLFEAIYYATEWTQVPRIVLSKALESVTSHDHVIRGYSFGILRAAAKADRNCEEVFIRYCLTLRENLMRNWNVDLSATKDYVDLLETVVSVSFLDVQVFTNKDKNVWKRELLISDIIERFQVSKVSQIYFYKSWFSAEKTFGFDKSCKILLLIQKCQFDSVSEIIDLIEMIQDLYIYQDAEQLLIIYSPNPFQAVLQEWTMTKVQECLINKDVNLAFLRQLAAKLCQSFDAHFIKRLFQHLQKIENIRAFQDFINFCLKVQLHEIFWCRSFVGNQLHPVPRFLIF